MLFGALMVVAPSSAGADHTDPSGFNGTVKTDGLLLDDGPGHTNKPNDPRDDRTDTDPHIDCGLQLEFFNFDHGETADITITAQPPSGKDVVVLQQLGVEVSEDDAGGAGNDLDATLDYAVPGDFDDLDELKAHPIHGWHVKLEVNIFRDGETPQLVGQKHKVFWLEGCEPPPPSTAALSVLKLVDPEPDGDGPSFAFTGPEGAFQLIHDGTDSFIVAPGEHTVTETEAQGYDLEDVTCYTDYGGEGEEEFAATAVSPAA